MAETDPPQILRVLLDQNVPVEVTAWLTGGQPSWEVVHWSDIGTQGARDAEVYRWAQDNGHMIVTFDAAFADGRTFSVGQHWGVIRLRVWPTTFEEARVALERLFEGVAASEIAGNLIPAT